MRDHSLGGDARTVEEIAKPDLYEIHIRGVMSEELLEFRYRSHHPDDPKRDIDYVS